MACGLVTVNDSVSSLLGFGVGFKMGWKESSLVSSAHIWGLL